MTNKFPKITIPNISLNGTTEENLIEEIRLAKYALVEAERLLVKIHPHGRDYNTGELLNKARDESRGRIIRVQSVINELDLLLRGIVEGELK